METVVENDSCQTQIKVVKCNYKWVIDNFQYCCEETGEFFKSSKFFANECEPLKWSLRIYPNGFNEDSMDFVSLYLHLESGNEPEIKANIRFAILNGQGQEINSTKIKAFRCEEDTIRGVNTFLSRDDLFNKENLPENKLTILCEVDMVQRVTVNEQRDVLNKVQSSVTLQNCDSEDLPQEKEKKMKLVYNWPIPSFINCTEKIIESRTFTAPNNTKYEWFLRVYPEGLCEKESVSVFLYLETNNEPENGVKGNISIQDENGEQIVKNILRPMTYAAIPSYYVHFPKQSLIIGTENDKLVLGNNLTLICEIEFDADEYKLDQIDNVITCKDLPVDLPVNPQTMFSDVILEVDGREFNSHKVILAAKSRFFAALFDNETKDEPLDRVVITDVDYDVLCEVLRFIYTGMVQNLKKVAVRLLAAAEKFSLEKLKIKCEEILAAKQREMCQVPVAEKPCVTPPNDNTSLLFTPN